MSTKRLSKTAIEGGRRGFNKWERRHSHAEVRAEERDYLKQVMIDLEAADEEEIDLPRPVYKEFSDKLNPMYRWLESQVGRPWDEVRSEVFTKFDTRTTAGRHITFDHLLQEVVDTESGFDKRGRMIDPNIPVSSPEGPRRSYWSFASYYVDQEGILCKPPTRSYGNYERISEIEFQDAEVWLANRIVMEKEGKLYWLSPTQDIWKATWLEPGTSYIQHYSYQYKLRYYVLTKGAYESKYAYNPSWDPNQTLYVVTKKHGDYWELVENPYSFRRRGELSAEEVKYFRSLKRKIRQDILSFSKGRS